MSPAASSPDRRAAVALVIGGITSVQFGSALATHLFDDVGPAGTVLLRTVFAAAVLSLFRHPIARGLSGVQLRDIGLFAITLASMNFFFYEGLERLPLGIAVTLEFVGPLTIAILGTRNRLDLLWVALAGAGILLLAPDIGDGLDATGVAFSLIAGGFWGGYILMSARVGRGIAGRGGLSSAMIVASILLLPVGIPDGGGELLQPGILAAAFGVAVLSSAIPYTLELEALRRLPERVFGVLLSLEPAVAAIVGLIVLGQHLVSTEVIAIGLVVAASAGALSSAEAVEAPQS
ncbi:MAG: EamA family transporter [Solirubrobacterales bacterium]|nr:EamA family transporter [Solirubrobacterales bacterium]